MESLIFLGLMLVVFYFFLIRPQQKKAKKHKEFVEALKPGDQVITSSGIFGKITSIKDNKVTLEVAKNTRIQILRNFVAHRASADAEKELSEAPQN